MPDAARTARAAIGVAMRTGLPKRSAAGVVVFACLMATRDLERSGHADSGWLGQVADAARELWAAEQPPDSDQQGDTDDH